MKYSELFEEKTRNPKIKAEYERLSDPPLNRLDYKGYYSLIHFDAGGKVLYGQIENANGDIVLFESESALEIEKEFHDAVDDWLEFRKEIESGIFA